MAELTISKDLFAGILERIGRLRQQVEAPA
jgi:hypothetical protein